ncbi:hypothetical protein E4Q23_19845 [Candidatus Accumulibacter phosphatis]|uniref:Uncharacterized protein n=1 Tax=Candidatus Accumulibacter phosphatis TaxID=327160 RepID=A0ABX1U457_9PROT|nr:hypothetical protein [Candidatus Accumulibacter phosphatis]NMQ29815.1 hypothetical protein [Candidatus Accumulibacter phosphatis]
MATLAWCTLAIVVQYVSQKEYFDEDGRSSYYFTLVLLISNTVWFFRWHDGKRRNREDKQSSWSNYYLFARSAGRLPRG